MRRIRADWLALILHLGLGLVVGALCGVVALGKRRWGWWLAPDLHWLWILGAALLGGALGARHGDRLWLRTLVDRSLFPPKAPTHSGASWLFCVVLGLAGIAVMLTALVRNFSN